MKNKLFQNIIYPIKASVLPPLRMALIGAVIFSTWGFFCTGEENPDIESIAIEKIAGTPDAPDPRDPNIIIEGTPDVYNVKITLGSVNKAEKTSVMEKIKIHAGYFGGKQIREFDIISQDNPTWESDTYLMTSINPGLVKGRTYFFIFADGTFNNEGAGIGDAKWNSGKSDDGVYKLHVY